MSCLIQNIDWGVVTKFPIDEKDYRLLASSGGAESRSNYHVLIRDWMVGELPFHTSGSTPGAPWYLFGIVANPLRQIIIQQKWTDYTDRHSRPVQQMTCLLIPFKELSAAACGFFDMAEIFEQPEVNTFLSDYYSEIRNGRIIDDSERISVNLPSRAESLSRVREKWVQSAPDLLINLVGALIEKPLGLTWVGDPILSWRERLQWLDMIMTFLPYGVRADCPASSWASSGVSHKMRLYWTGRALSNHHQVWLREENEIGQLADDCVYIRGLRDHMQQNSLPDIVNQLSGIDSAMTLNQLKGINLFKPATRPQIFPSRVPGAPTIPEKTESEKPVIHVQQPVPERIVLTSRPDRPEIARTSAVEQTRTSASISLEDVVAAFMHIQDSEELTYFSREAWELVRYGEGVVFIRQLQDQIRRLPIQQRNVKQEHLIHLLNIWLIKLNKADVDMIYQCTNELDDDNWMLWVYGVVKRKHQKMKFINCLGQLPERHSFIVYFVKYIVGQIRELKLADASLDSYFRKFDFRYPIWLIRLDALYFLHGDDVFFTLSNFLLRLKAQGNRLPQEALREMFNDKNVTNRGCFGGIFRQKRNRVLDGLRRCIE